MAGSSIRNVFHPFHCERGGENEIVLWAHNGHVRTASGGGYSPMGALLREMFGTQMVVFGFAFNQGSFQAYDPGKGLRHFTVPPSLAGSLDAKFATTKIPLFALDLKAIPKTGPVARWFSQPHQTRTIGAVFSESSAAQYLMYLTASVCFDVMLFVEKTTAARKEPVVVPDPNLEYGWLGIQFSRDVEKPVVDVVLPDSPAAKAGIKTGDVILKVDMTTFTR